MNILSKLKDSIKNSSFWIDTPKALPWGEWDDWHKKIKSEKPFSYFILKYVPEQFDHAYKRYIKYPINSFMSFVCCRFIEKYYLIDTGLNKNRHHDFDQRSMNGIFNMIVNHIESTLAFNFLCGLPDEERKNVKGITFLNYHWPYLTTFKNPELGLKHLKWEMTLDSPSLPIHDQSICQAETARELWELYHWWKFIRPNRIEPMDASGWSDWCSKYKNIGNLFRRKLNKSEKEQEQQILDKLHEIEKNYNDEDDAQFIRLIKIRRNIWI